ncbi:MAG: hypothetical protein H8D96_20720 [Desulfobacterales bacterium]|uniref:Uncharacterized protein n=1 Tax=Candidatus Desulfatibia vada TaxID=2841696 RepID=A0A8J6P9C3_9BACT|nr:hypothetical protein [Candidatus Desulfatibia vada]MBL6972226.1 hypothetical protein [Desulfobacterales bacterium]
MAIDVILSTFLWVGLYFGFEPGSILGNLKYQQKMRKAIAKKINGHKDHVGSNLQTSSTDYLLDRESI